MAKNGLIAVTSDPTVRYDLLVQEALRGVVRKVLEDVATQGLRGEHYYMVSFRTGAEGVRLSKRMRDKYPDEMTIVFQHQFWDLAVTEHAFEVGLSFSGIPERLLVPFETITVFQDPSVAFALQFSLLDGSEDGDDDDDTVQDNADNDTDRVAAFPSSLLKANSSEAPPEEDGEKKSASVVSLDAFRKKP
jgi:uncharacterized protein